jgi:hypothetical protein
MTTAGDRFSVGKWHIYFDPPPIPPGIADWHFYHDDFDGAPDAGDNRCGSAGSLAECLREIADLMEDSNDR